MKNGIIIIIFFMLTIQTAFAHGENKLGPHDGYIRMPGAFHTELVPSHEDSFSVYLMDVNNKNALVNNSSVTLTHVSKKGQKTNFTCFPIDDHFTCKLGKKINSKEGKFQVLAKRNGIEGKVAEYPIPLKLEGEEPKSGHENHNMK
jgi:anionic cell wall polymer biosynthesis LytR-Cps2A-Psr (LCP) family protein